MTEILVKTLKPGKYFTMPVYLDDKYILLSPETPLSKELLDRLDRWRLDYVFSEGDQSDEQVTTDQAPGEQSDETVIADLESEVYDSSASGSSRRFFLECLTFLERIFTFYVKQGTISVNDVTEQVKRIIDQVNNMRQYMLRITEFHSDTHNYIAVHSVKSTIIAVAIGATMRMPNHKLIELGTSTLMHEIGMIKLPAQIYMSNKMLSPTEKKAITAHTLLGYKTLKQNSFPMSVCLGVLECRENMDGSGYPRGLTGERISTYAKIINIASTYSALTSKRPFRGAFNGHSSLMDMLKKKGTIYDEAALRILILILSVYPLGTYVVLQNSARGMVVETNEGNYRAPKVSILTSPEGNKQIDRLVVNTEASNYGIVRPLSNEEISKVKKIANIQ